MKNQNRNSVILKFDLLYILRVFIHHPKIFYFFFLWVYQDKVTHMSQKCSQWKMFFFFSSVIVVKLQTSVFWLIYIWYTLRYCNCIFLINTTYMFLHLFWFVCNIGRCVTCSFYQILSCLLIFFVVVFLFYKIKYFITKFTLKKLEYYSFFWCIMLHFYF